MRTPRLRPRAQLRLRSRSRHSPGRVPQPDHRPLARNTAAEQAPRSLLKVFAPLLWIPVAVVVVGVLKIVLRNRIRRREIDFIGASPIRATGSPISSPSAVPRPEITRLTRDAMDRLEWRRFEELTQAYFEKIGWSAKRSAVGVNYPRCRRTFRSRQVGQPSPGPSSPTRDRRNKRRCTSHGPSSDFQFPARH